MYKLKLKDGTILSDLILNEDYFISQFKEIDVAILHTSNLSEVVVTDQDTEESYTLYNCMLCNYRLDRQKNTFIAIREKTEQELQAESERATMKSVTNATSIAFVVLAESGTIDEVTATENLDMFAEWASNVHYSLGALRRYAGVLYKCVQEHTSQETWTPDVSASLWSRAGDPTVEYPDWSQPIGAHDAYMVGDKVSHNDAKWVSDADNNVWEPGVYGWTQVIQE